MAILALVVGTALAIGVATISIANETPYVSTCLRSTVGEGSDCQGFPGLIVNFGVRVMPRKLPKREMAPVAVELWGKVSRSDGTHPSALRKATIDFDRNLVIDAKGLPTCRSGHRDPIERDSIPKACDNSIVGGGKVDFELAFPGAPLVLNPSKLTIYNGGVKGGITTLYVVAPIDIPVPRTIVIPVEIARTHEGRYGLHVVAKVPVIAGGSGSLLDFSLRIKRLLQYKNLPKSIASARCPDGHFGAEISTLFMNEAQTPGVALSTVTKGRLVFPCMSMSLPGRSSR